MQVLSQVVLISLPRLLCEHSTLLFVTDILLEHMPTCWVWLVHEHVLGSAWTRQGSPRPMRLCGMSIPGSLHVQVDVLPTVGWELSCSAACDNRCHHFCCLMQVCPAAVLWLQEVCRASKGAG